MLIFLGLLQGAANSGGSAATALAVPVLALIGALALACFIKVFGAVFLGQARTPATAEAAEVPWSMRLPMLVLAGGCLTIGLAPALVAPLLDRTIDAWLPAAPLLSPPLAEVSALATLGVLQPLLALLAVVLLAGLMPLHVWLPGLHAGAPSHISAVLSGVMLNVGLYGLVRISGLLAGLSTEWGAALLILGAGSAVAGMARGLGEPQLKRLLACSSMENMGVMVMGLGLALLGRAQQQPVWILLGLGGTLLHMWNHALFKSLLFFGAGAVLHSTGTGRLDRRMPRVTALFALGALAACALPPLNGFVSEWLLYLGCFRAQAASPAGLTGVAAAGLALAGALTLAAFAKALGTGFLGTARSPAAELAHDPGFLMLAPMVLAATLVLVLGLAPGLALPSLLAAAGVWSGVSTGGLPADVQLAVGWLSGCALLLLVLGAMFVRLGRARIRRATRVPTWDCGYARPDGRMQTTAGSLAQTVTGLLAPDLSLHVRPVRPQGLFPAPVRQPVPKPELLLERCLRPAWKRLTDLLQGLHVFQQGLTQHYILYLLAALLGLMLLASVGEPR